MCSGGPSIGDIHLTNFNGLMFDFQASGDFLLAEPDPEFVVQTRQKSGAPTWPNVPVAKVLGLLGNANGNTGADDLAARGGAVLSRPVSFADLYQLYGESWRVPADESLLTKLCGDKPPESRDPEKPFYAKDLDPKIYKRASAICRQAGVKQPALLDACILDTAVLGDRTAARAFVRPNAPRAEMRVGPRAER